MSCRLLTQSWMFNPPAIRLPGLCVVMLFLGACSDDPAAVPMSDASLESGVDAAVDAQSARDAASFGDAATDAAVDPTVFLPSKDDVVRSMRIVNDYWIHTHADPGHNRWDRATYFEGNQAMYQVYPDPKYLSYALKWAEQHEWKLNGGTETRHADNHCAGQIYLDLYRLDPQPERIADIEASLELMLETDKVDDWTWVDALQMAMPVFAGLGAERVDLRYFGRLHDMYTWTKTVPGEGGLYSESDHLWWRDRRFKPPLTAANGEDVYWSRGNGWAFAALLRTLDALPETEIHREEYEEDFVAMAEALAAIQGDDGFWRASLHDADEFPTPETSGTAFFVYGLAWGVNRGLLDESTYIPVIAKGWHGLVDVAIHEDGKLGYIQAVGDRPAEVAPDDHRDFGVGAFLLAGSQVLELAPEEMPGVSAERNVAIGQMVVATSEQEGNEALGAVDGDDTTRWSAFSYPHSLTVGLSETQSVSGIELAVLDQRAYEFVVEGRTNGSTEWTILLNESNNTEVGPLLERSFEASAVDEVRLTVTGVAGDATDWISIIEFRVLEE